MLKIGLTGGIGSGKSTVSNIFKVLGIPVFDADSIAKQLMESDPGLRVLLIRQFGEKVFQDDQLNRAYLANIVFNDAYQLNLLNSIVHPVTIAAAEEWFNRQHSPYVVKEAALMFESGAAAGLDAIVGVFAPKALRVKRVMDRDGMDRTQVLARMDKQIDESLKMRLCNAVIQNDEQISVIEQVVKLHEQFSKGHL